MADAFLSYFRSTLPEELAASLSEQLNHLEQGNFDSVLENDLVQVLLGHKDRDSTKDISLENYPVWSDYVFRRIGALLQDQEDSVHRQHLFFIVGLASLYAFLQSNVTGPPLPFQSARTLLPERVAADPAKLAALRNQLILSLGADGEAAYKLTPNVELFCLADAIVTSPAADGVKAARWAKLRVDFLHQRLLSEIAPSLQATIYGQLEALSAELLADETLVEYRIPFLLERATIHTHHDFDKKAREDLDRAAKERGFEFALTGLLGKRTKYQEKDVSQLLVLARSAGTDVDGTEAKGKGKQAASEETAEDNAARPKNLDLNDDTLLESISFSETPKSPTDVVNEAALPEGLASLDPSNQPMLNPLDSIILLSLASSITNTSPVHGLTREETLPYATRVLEGGSSNWQVYTQALLVRSRIEGYRSRTVERGLLQLQAVVDQVIADTTSDGATPIESNAEGSATTFLPKAREEESAAVNERLRYVFQLASPSRWELESELAQRWVQMGGLRSALEIYERLQMWAEAALCWAATEREDKAKKIVRRQLFHATDGNDNTAGDEENWEGAARDPAPADAPRLYCILGDIDKDPDMYERAWEVSGNRYARAQRSLGRYYHARNDLTKAANAYSKSLKVNQLNHATWFALGCALLELSQFERAVEAFSRTVQLDDTDAEAWSNLAAALLRLEPKEDEDIVQNEATTLPDEEEDAAYTPSEARRDPQQHKKDALKALKRAANLKFDNYRIWDNFLTVAASLIPPSYTDVCTALRRIIDLRGPTDGERCIDATILDLLVRHITSSGEPYDAAAPGLPRMVVRLVDEAVVPLITASRRLWQTVARLALWRRRPGVALDAHEKAWRAVVSQPGWETGTEAAWDEVVDATVELAEAYESLGPMERTEGLGAGAGQLVARDWKFKARTAVKGVCGRGRDSWEGTGGWERLRGVLEGLKG